MPFLTCNFVMCATVCKKEWHYTLICELYTSISLFSFRNQLNFVNKIKLWYTVYTHTCMHTHTQFSEQNMYHWTVFNAC